MIKKDEISAMVVDLCEEQIENILCAKCAGLPPSRYEDVSLSSKDVDCLLETFLDNIDLSEGVSDDVINSYLIDFLRCSINDNFSDIEKISIKLKLYIAAEIINLQDYMMQYLPEEWREAKEERRLFNSAN